jgi:hypothetical protein
MPALMRPPAATACLVLTALLVSQAACQSRDRLPAALTDDEFWTLIEGLSEPAGDFARPDNLVSNETHVAEMVRLLRPRGGVYIGVGPEQNFSYIAEIQPALAFVVDIRRENRDLHLLYKALFELSVDRVDFLSRLFSRQAARQLDARSSVEDLFAALEGSAPDSVLHDTNQSQVHQRLEDHHRFPLSPEDLDSIDAALQAFYSAGPEIHYGRSRPDTTFPSYRALMTTTDIMGQTRSFLASAGRFALVKALHERNLIVPVVGNFGGTHALRGISDYVRGRGATVSAFYGSNVQVYLSNAQTSTFCETLAGLPHTSGSWFIGSKGMQRFPAKLKDC